MFAWAEIQCSTWCRGLTHLKCMRRPARIETSRTVRSGFTRCLHYLAATVEYVRHGAWPLSFPVTLEEGFCVQRTLACPFSVLGSMARDAAPFVGRKCRVYKVSPAEAFNGTYHSRQSSFLVASRSHRLAFIRSRVASLSDQSYPPFALGPPRFLLLQPFALPSVLLLLSLALF